jgi:Peptidase A4 family
MKAIAAVLAAVALAAGTVGSSAAATAASSNWAGYAVSGTTFKTVSGTWVQPTANCSSGTAETTASAFWVGLGGNSDTSSSLEQTGTEADCLANGTTRYTAWYELVPASSVRVSLRVSAGDRISGSVRAAGTKVTVQLRNLTTGKSFTKTLRMASPDVASAEWIAEAPSAIVPGGTRILPLTDFGTVRFASATATSSAGHTGTIADSAWTTSRILLESGDGGPGNFGPYAAESAGTEAVPGALSSTGAFSITWRQTASPTGPQFHT